MLLRKKDGPSLRFRFSIPPDGEGSQRICSLHIYRFSSKADQLLAGGSDLLTSPFDSPRKSWKCVALKSDGGSILSSGSLPGGNRRLRAAALRPAPSGRPPDVRRGRRPFNAGLQYVPATHRHTHISFRFPRTKIELYDVEKLWRVDLVEWSLPGGGIEPST